MAEKNETEGTAPGSHGRGGPVEAFQERFAGRSQKEEEPPPPSPYRRRRGLSATQRLAIVLRARGMSLAAIARELGVHRVTVSRWFNRDEVVIAAYNGAMEEFLADEWHGRMRLGSRAQLVVERAVEYGHLKTALEVVSLHWRYPPRFTVGPTDPEGVRLELARQELGRLLPPGPRPLADLTKLVADLSSRAANRCEIELRDAWDTLADVRAVIGSLDDLAELTSNVYTATLHVWSGLWHAEGEGLRELSHIAADQQRRALLAARASLDRVPPVLRYFEPDDEEYEVAEGDVAEAVGALGEALTSILLAVEEVHDPPGHPAPGADGSIRMALERAREAMTIEIDEDVGDAPGRLARSLFAMAQGLHWLVGAAIAALAVEQEPEEVEDPPDEPVPEPVFEQEEE